MHPRVQFCVHFLSAGCTYTLRAVSFDYPDCTRSWYKSQRMRWAVQMARMWAKRNVYKSVLGKRVWWSAVTSRGIIRCWRRNPLRGFTYLGPCNWRASQFVQLLIIHRGLPSSRAAYSRYLPPGLLHNLKSPAPTIFPFSECEVALSTPPLALLPFSGLKYSTALQVKQ